MFLTHPCTTCGERLEPVEGRRTMLACRYCGTEQHFRAAPRRLVDPDWEALAPKEKRAYADDSDEALVVPDAVLPFAVDRAAARRTMREWARRRPFAPRAFRRIDESASFRGVFLPHWVWSGETRSRYVAARGDHYWSRGRGADRSRRTRWSPARGTVADSFADVVVAGTGRIDARVLEDLRRDWPIGEAVPFAPRLLDGYWVQPYDVGPDLALELAKIEAAAGVEARVCEAVGGDEQRVRSIDTVYAGLDYRLVLLPVWMVSFSPRGRRRLVLVHGRSGRVIGMRPWSAWKLATAMILTLVVAGAILYFNSLSE